MAVIARCSLLLLVCLTASAWGQQCLNISGACVAGQCPSGETCVGGAMCCVTDAAANCPNQLDDSFCDSQAAMCTNPSTKDAMSKQCPKTCKTCSTTATTSSPTPGGGTGSGSTVAPPTQTCVDKVGPNGVSDCAKDAYLCDNPSYYALMTEQCPKTCGRCPGTTGGTGGNGGTGGIGGTACVDKVGPNGVSDCAKDAYLCNNSAYYQLMTEQCPKTCGRC